MSTTPKPIAVTALRSCSRDSFACAPRSPFARSFLEYVDPDDRLGCLATLLGPEPVPLVAMSRRVGRSSTTPRSCRVRACFSCTTGSSRSGRASSA